MAPAPTSPVAPDSFGARATLTVGDASYEIYRINALADRFDVARLPYSIKVVLENLLRHEDGLAVRPADIEAVAGWGDRPERHGLGAEDAAEIALTPERVLMQDFTGVPCVVDLAAMRDALSDPRRRPGQGQPAGPGRAGHRPLGHRRGVGRPRGLRRERRHRVPAEHRALPAPALGPAGLRRLPGGAARHRDLPPGQPRVPVAGGVRHRRRQGLLRHAGRHRLPHHHGQRARRPRAGGSAASRPRRPCWASRCPCSSPRWSGSA